MVKKAFLSERTKDIEINSEHCYLVDLYTANTNEIHVEAEIEGEYSKDLVITIEENETTVLISAGFQPNFNNPNDKLSAHKIISIKLNITVPNDKRVFVYGTNSNVTMKGNYENLKVKLLDGNCSIDNVGDRVEVTTQKGNILLIADNGNIMVESTYGKVVKEHIPQGQNQYSLKTIEGNINLRKTK
nr:hypothetical protein [uncultured Allomuricauda sp.]